MKLRPATENDLEAVRSIFNYYIDTSTCTFNLEATSREEIVTTFRARTDKLPLIVAEIDERVVGWASLSQWSRSGTAYSRSVEGSVYVDKDHHRKGIGKL